MHICVLSNRPPEEDPAARVMIGALERAGNRLSEVRVVSPSQQIPEDLSAAVPSRVPRGGGALGALLRRVQPERWRLSDLRRRLADAAASTGASLFLPLATNLMEAAVGAAHAAGGAVMRTPAQPDAGDFDLIRLAPHHPEMNRPPAGGGLFHTPADDRTPYHPEPGRHAGKKVLLAYRKTDTNPGKYLEEALRRSGAEVTVETASLNFAAVDPATDFIVFVEGPYPAIDVHGETPPMPVLYWFHHGEHHLHANLRLADRYRADAVLMAHSWHLAHWIPAPVHRFPFGIPVELLRGEKALRDRRYDVAMVGAKLWDGGPYGRRQQIVAELEAALPNDRLGFAENVTAQEMAALYEEARIIPNEGGTRHFPVTMRVFEAIAARAVLLTDDLPGTDLLFRPGEHYLTSSEDIVTQVKELLDDPDGMQRMADAALQHARGRHTYDHRVDELFEIAASTPKRQIPALPRRSPLAEVIDRDAEVQRVAQIGAPYLWEELDSRQVFDARALAPHRLAPAKMETVAIAADDLSGLEDVLASARRYLYFTGEARGLDKFLREYHPEAVVDRQGPITRVDLLAESYRVLPHEVIDDPA